MVNSRSMGPHLRKLMKKQADSPWGTIRKLVCWRPRMYKVYLNTAVHMHTIVSNAKYCHQRLLSNFEQRLQFFLSVISMDKIHLVKVFQLSLHLGGLGSYWWREHAFSSAPPRGLFTTVNNCWGLQFVGTDVHLVYSSGGCKFQHPNKVKGLPCFDKTAWLATVSLFL